MCACDAILFAHLRTISFLSFLGEVLVNFLSIFEIFVSFCFPLVLPGLMSRPAPHEELIQTHEWKKVNVDLVL